MRSVPCIRLPHSPIRGYRTRAIRRWFVALMIVSATTAVATQGEAAEGGRGVASHIPATTADTAHPVAVIDRQDIELSGMTSVWDLLQTRSDYNSFGLHRPLVLGNDYAVFLVNGRRIPSPTLSWALESLPISAVERIEILSDSAAALHGGQAIGGAVNIVLRRDLDGVELQGSLARPGRRGGDAEHASAVWGGAVGRGKVTFGMDSFRRQEIRRADLDYSRASWTPGGSFADASGVSVAGNTVFIPTEEGGSIARAIGECSDSAYTGVLTQPLGMSGTGCGFAYADSAWLFSPEHVQREGLFVNLDHPLGDDGDLYVDARFARTETASRQAPAADTFSFMPPEALRQTLLADPDIDSLPETLRVSHRFVGHGNRDWGWDIDEHDLALGLRGRLAGGIGYDAHLRSYRHAGVNSGDTFVSETAIQSAIEEGRYDLANPLSTDPEHLAAIRESALRWTGDLLHDYKVGRVSLDGTAFALGGGEARWAAGAEAVDVERKETNEFRDIEGRSHEPGDVLGVSGYSAVGKRRRWSVFAEATLPLHSDWDVTLAGRRDDHDDVGAKFSHQVASRYRLNESLTLRGSWSGGGSAPGLRALHTREMIDDARICDTGTHTGNRQDCSLQDVEVASGGNPDLEPDEAESVSLGAVAGLGPLSLGADWFRIKLSGQPAQLSPQSVVDLDAQRRLPPSGAAVIRKEGSITRVEASWANVGETDAAGINVHAHAGWETDWADLVFDARWLRVARYEQRVAGETQPADHPRDRVHASLRASRGDVTVNWSVRAVSGYRNEPGTGRYKAWTGHDITLRWRDVLGVSGLDLTAGVLNVGDRGPSIDPTNPEQPDVRLDSALGRTLFLTTNMRW